MKRRYADSKPFFHSDSDELGYQIANLFFTAEQRSCVPRGLIIPFGAVEECGVLAAKAFLSVRPFSADIGRVLLLSLPSSANTTGLLSTHAEQFVTPLGELDIDIQAVKACCNADVLHLDTSSFQKALSLDFALPLLQMCLPDFRLVPLLFCKNAGQCLASLLRRLWDEKTLLVVVANIDTGSNQQTLPLWQQLASGGQISQHIDQPSITLLNSLQYFLAQQAIELTLVDYLSSPRGSTDQLSQGYAGLIMH